MTGPVAARPAVRLRWGIPDAFIAWAVGFAASFPAVIGLKAGASLGPGRTFLAVVLQNVGIVAALWLISVLKGQHSIVRDFGFPAAPSLRPTVVGVWVGAGVGGSVVVNLLLWPIERIGHLQETTQDVARTVTHARGLALVLLFVAIVLVAPIVEELLFRGVLLRSLQRRFSTPVAVFLSALAFGAAHIPGGGQAYALVPGLVLLGLVSGVLAARSGDLTRSICLHVGFNFLSWLFLVLR